MNKVFGAENRSGVGRTAMAVMMSDEMVWEKGLPFEADVFVTHAELLHGSSFAHYRPYLRLSGEVRGLTGMLSGEETEISFMEQEGGYPSVDYVYQFSDSQLASLAEKGLFSEEFRIPDIFIDNSFELPVKASVCSVDTLNAPLVFVEVVDRFDMQIDMESCGYDLAKYFEPVQKVEQAEDEVRKEAEDEAGLDGPDVVQQVEDRLSVKDTEFDSKETIEDNLSAVEEYVARQKELHDKYIEEQQKAAAVAMSEGQEEAGKVLSEKETLPKDDVKDAEKEESDLESLFADDYQDGEEVASEAEVVQQEEVVSDERAVEFNDEFPVSDGAEDGPFMDVSYSDERDEAVEEYEDGFGFLDEMYREEEVQEESEASFAEELEREDALFDKVRQDDVKEAVLEEEQRMPEYNGEIFADDLREQDEPEAGA